MEKGDIVLDSSTHSLCTIKLGCIAQDGLARGELQSHAWGMQNQLCNDVLSQIWLPGKEAIIGWKRGERGIEVHCIGQNLSCNDLSFGFTGNCWKKSAGKG